MSNAAAVGSTSGEKTYSAAVSGSGFGARKRSSAACVHFTLDRRQDVGEILVGGEAFALQEVPHAHQRIAPRFGLALGRRLVQLLVVRERVRVRAGDGRVDEHRTLARADVRDGVAHRAIAGEVVGAVAAEHPQAGEAFDEA